MLIFSSIAALIFRPFLKMGIILIVTLLFAQNSYSFGIFFGGNDDEQSKVLTATAEVLDNIATYKAEADISFKEKNIEAVLDKYQKLYALIETYDLEEERLSYYLYLTKINHYQHDNLSLLSNLNSAMLIALDLGDDQNLAYIYSRMGYVHYDEFNYFLAKSLISQAGEMYIEDNNDKALVEIYYNLNVISAKLNQLDEAEEFRVKYDELVILYPNLDIFKLLVDESKNRRLDVRSKFAEKGFIEANIVEIQILNKVTARVYKFTMKIGDELKFENINITPRSCWKAPSNQLPNNYAFFDIMDNQTYEHIFYGWILSSNPSLNSMTHQFYNISLRNCVTKDYK